MPKPLPILGLHHIARVTARPEESAAFYRDVLGFQDLTRPNFSFRGAWLYNYGVQIHIIEHAVGSNGRSEQIDSRTNHVAFRVEDMDAVKESLSEHDIQYREQVNAGGIHQIFFQDPDGHHIEISLAGDPSIGYQAEANDSRSD